MMVSNRSAETPTVIDAGQMALNHERDIEIQHVTVAGTNVLVIDGLYRSPDYVQALALSLDYYRQAGFYPGHFAFVSLSQMPLLALLNASTGHLLGGELVFHEYYQDLTFAIMTKVAGALSPMQRQPHFDTFCDVAGVVYLNPPEHCSGGTSFWRHRSTGLEMAPREGDPSARAMAPLFGVRDEKELIGFCLAEALADPAEGFLTGNTRFWELTKVIPMRYNRLILYNARLFHMPHVENGAFGDTKETRRLTQNVYFNLRKKHDGVAQP